MWRRLLNWVAANPWPITRTAEPLLYLAVWVGAIHVLFIDWAEDSLGMSPDLGFPHSSIGYLWVFLMLSSPIQVVVAWLLIRFKTGRCRVFGMWNRLGGNLGVFLGLSAFVTSRVFVHDANPPDGPLFGLIVIGFVAAFTFTLVVRDMLSLYALRMLADEIYRDNWTGE